MSGNSVTDVTPKSDNSTTIESIQYMEGKTRFMAESGEKMAAVLRCAFSLSVPSVYPVVQTRAGDEKR